MAKILYQARNADGKRDSGYIEAATLDEARALLLARGLSEPKFFNEPAAAALREDLKDLPDAEQARQAAFELRLREQPGYAVFIQELWRRQRIWLLIDAGLFIVGVWQDNAVMWGLALLYFGLTVLWPLWRFRHAHRYNAMLRAFALGEWSKALALISELKAGAGRDLLMRSDFAFREACIRIRTGESSLARETEALHDLHAELEASSPGMFDMRYASLCAAAGDGAGVVTAMKRARLLNPGDASRLVDVANSEARFGSVDDAEAHLAKVDEQVLPDLGVPFMAWTRGLIALRRNEAQAESFLEEAMRGFMVYAANPAVLGPVGLCGGAYAIALARNGRHKPARDVVRQVSPVLKAHGDAALLTMLRYEMKKAKMAESEAV